MFDIDRCRGSILFTGGGQDLDRIRTVNHVSLDAAEPAIRPTVDSRQVLRPKQQTH